MVYPSRLPRMSIIIVFHNEALSTLLRTAFSAANRAPPELVREVIFVDDNSDTDELTSPDLEAKLQALLPNGASSRVLRSGNVRLGLIRARMMGAEVAKGPVLVFFDAHIEASPGWAVPLLSEVAADRTRVAMPSSIN